MRIVTDHEIKEMHKLLDSCIDKMNSKKNRVKPHWNTLSLKTIQYMLTVENAELDLALYSGTLDDVRSELKDIINLSIFAMHNIRDLIT